MARSKLTVQSKFNYDKYLNGGLELLTPYLNQIGGLLDGIQANNLAVYMGFIADTRGTDESVQILQHIIDALNNRDIATLKGLVEQGAKIIEALGMNQYQSVQLITSRLHTRPRTYDGTIYMDM